MQHNALVMIMMLHSKIRRCLLVQSSTGAVTESGCLPDASKALALAGLDSGQEPTSQYVYQ